MAEKRTTVNTFAEQALDDADIALLARLAERFDAEDPVPDGLVERLQFGITLDALQAEIAQLERMEGLVGARGEATEVQTITFTSSTLTTMVTISQSGGDRVRIDGWAAPGGGVRVELRVVGGDRHVTADSDGRFVIEDVPKGMAQFVLRAPDGSAQAPVITPSIEL